MADDYIQKVKDKEREQSTLTARQKGDEELLYLAKYVMKDADKSNVEDIINVTLNRPAVFAANTVAALGKTSEQRVVESEDKKLDTAYVEDFQKAAFAAADDRLRRQGRMQLNPSFDTQFCIRGRAAARCVFQMVDGVLVTEIVPWDARADFLTYEMGADGPRWAANKTQRSKDKILAQYEEELAKYHVYIPDKGAEVLDVWHTEGNEVSINENKILEQEHNFGFTPVCIQIVSLGYGGILLGVDRVKNEGESIFFLIRDVIPEMNRLASIMQTLNLKAVKPPMGWGSKEGQTATSPEYEEATGMATITPTDIGGGAKPIDYGDAQRSASLAMAMFDTAIGEGTLSSADLGRIGSPPASGVRAIIAGENRDQILDPRLEAKALMNESLTEMFTKQVIAIGGSVELGMPGHKRTFEISKLDGKYGTTYEYMAKSPATDAGLYSLAAAAGNLLSDRTKRTDILQIEDPEGEERQLAIERAKRLSPGINLDDTIRKLIEADENWWAEILSSEMGVNLKQMLAGEVAQQPKPAGEDKPTQVLSLFGGGRVRGAGKEKAPKEEE